jgi:hypothetical protein
MESPLGYGVGTGAIRLIPDAERADCDTPASAFPPTRSRRGSGIDEVGKAVAVWAAICRTRVGPLVELTRSSGSSYTRRFFGMHVPALFGGG